LQVALHVHRGGRWVGPAGGHEDEGRERPKKRQGEEKPSQKSDEGFPARGLGASFWIFGHSSE